MNLTAGGVNRTWASRSASRAAGSRWPAISTSRALLETALNASVLRAQLALGMNSFVIRTDAGSFDFRRAFSRGLGAEYRETRLLAEAFFRGYAVRAEALRERQQRASIAEAPLRTELPETWLHDVVRSLRSMYQEQQEPIAFELVSVRGEEQRTQCEVFDRTGQPLAFDLVPITDDPSEAREYLLFFRHPVGPERRAVAAHARRPRLDTQHSPDVLLCNRSRVWSAVTGHRTPYR